MRLQTDQEFQNSKFNVKMFSNKIRGGKAFADEQKFGNLKNSYSKEKKFIKVLEVIELIQKNNSGNNR